MCQIIFKPANFSISRENLRSTCLVNPDGFGILYWNGEKLLSEKIYDSKGNNPDDLEEFLSDYHDKEIFMHFRFRTKGPVSKETCHPFEAYRNNDKGHLLYLMHNGTLSSWGDNNTVDSEDFAKNLVGPLYSRFISSGVDEPLKDELFVTVVDEFVGLSSKIVLFDHTGTYLVFNEKNGKYYKEDDGTTWWASNEYSFNKAHREKKETVYNYGGYNSTKRIYGKDGYWEGNLYRPYTDKEKLEREETLRKEQKERKEKKEKVVKELPKRETIPSYWADVLKLQNADELCTMTYEDCCDLVDLEPENAKLLLNDLLIELFDEYQATTSEDETPFEPGLLATH